MKPAVQHFEINSNDYEKAQKFYKDVFDWEIHKHEGMDYAIVARGNDHSIGGGIGQVQKGQKAMVTFYVTVDDIETYINKVEKAGGKIVMPLTPIPDVGACAMFTDLDGNVLGLFKGLDS